MAVSKKQQACVARYSAKNYDQLLVRVKKGRRDEIQAHAEAMGESVNAFIGRAIAEAMERDKTAPAPSGSRTEDNPMGIGTNRPLALELVKKQVLA